MHQYIIKCKPTKMSNTLYYAGWPGENCILWGPGADKAMPFVTRADAVALDMAIKELDKVIDYLYTETSEGQAFRDLLNVATKLKTLQFNMKEKK